MATIHELDRKRKEILLNMNPEELEALYHEINKKAIDSLGTVENNYTFNPTEIEKANKELEEINRILIKKYPSIEALGVSSRLELLVNKYDSILTEAKELEFNIIVVSFSSLVESLRSKINYLSNVLFKFYFRYSFRTSNFDSFLIDELGVPEDIVLVTLEPYVYYTTSFFSKSLEHDFNFFIKKLVIDIDSTIANVNYYLDFKINPSAFKEEGIIKSAEQCLQLQIMATKLIKTYEEIKLNPFEEAINIDAKSKVETLNKLWTNPSFKITVEEEKERLLRKAPSYNFETFELILPDIDLEEETERILKESVEKYSKGSGK